MKQFLILIRPYGMLFIGLTPVFGALANGESSPLNLIVLLIIGLLAHVFTFVQNDYYDIDIDRKSKYVANRPLSSGNITQKTVILIFISSLLASLILEIIFLFKTNAFLVLIIAFFCISLYNKYSKRFAGMEYILSIGVFFYGIFGALTVSNSISNFVLLVSLFAFLQWLFSVGVSANLKDVEFDTKQGIKTTPVLFGSHIEKKSLVLPLKFKAYAYTIKITHIFIAFLIFTFSYSTLESISIQILGIIFSIISLILIYLTYKILTTTLKKREIMLKYIGVQEGLSFLILPISMIGLLREIISLPISILLVTVMIVWPLFWFRCLYGKTMIPLE